MAPRRRWIDRKLLKELCQAQCTNDEISGALHVSWDTLQRRYAEVIKIWRGHGPMSCRRELYKIAMGPPSKGKVTSLIFYLKNYGGMADVSKDVTGQLNLGNLPISDEFKKAGHSDAIQ